MSTFEYQSVCNIDLYSDELIKELQQTLREQFPHINFELIQRFEIVRNPIGISVNIYGIVDSNTLEEIQDTIKQIVAKYEGA